MQGNDGPDQPGGDAEDLGRSRSERARSHADWRQRLARFRLRNHVDHHRAGGRLELDGSLANIAIRAWFQNSDVGKLFDYAGTLLVRGKLQVGVTVQFNRTREVDDAAPVTSSVACSVVPTFGCLKA